MSAPLTSIPSGTHLMPRLYAHAAGPLSAAYYSHHFERMEAQTHPLPTWNHAAAFNTLGWLCLRRMWMAAGIYAAAIALAIVLCGAVVQPLLGSTSALACAATLALLSVVLPGLWGNQLYYQHLRARTLQTLQASDTIAQAQQQLGNLAVTAQRRNHVAAVQAAAALLVAGAGLSFLPTQVPTAPAPAPNGPPVLHFPVTQQAAPAVAAPLASPPPAAPVPEAPTPPQAVTAPPSAAAPLVPPAAALPAQPSPAQAQPVRPVTTPAAVAPAAAPTARSAKTAAAAAELVPGHYYLNAGVFSQLSNADKAEHALRQAGLPVLRSTVQSAKGEVVRLRSGPFETAERARAAQRAAAKRQLEATVFQHRRRS